MASSSSVKGTTSSKKASSEIAGCSSGTSSMSKETAGCSSSKSYMSNEVAGCSSNKSYMSNEGAGCSSNKSYMSNEGAGCSSNKSYMSKDMAGSSSSKGYRSYEFSGYSSTKGTVTLKEAHERAATVRCSVSLTRLKIPEVLCKIPVSAICLKEICKNSVLHKKLDPPKTRQKPKETAARKKSEENVPQQISKEKPSGKRNTKRATRLKQKPKETASRKKSEEGKSKQTQSRKKSDGGSIQQMSKETELYKNSDKGVTLQKPNETVPVPCRRSPRNINKAEEKAKAEAKTRKSDERNVNRTLIFGESDESSESDSSEQSRPKVSEKTNVRQPPEEDTSEESESSEESSDEDMPVAKAAGSTQVYKGSGKKSVPVSAPLPIPTSAPRRTVIEEPVQSTSQGTSRGTTVDENAASGDESLEGTGLCRSFEKVITRLDQVIEITLAGGSILRKYKEITYTCKQCEYRSPRYLDLMHHTFAGRIKSLNE